jgi:uridylate kinase
METIIISLGGSVIISEDADITFFKRLVNLLKKLSLKYKILIVIGGGKIARKYIILGRELGLNEEILDDFGIKITRINARFLSSIIEISNKEIPSTTTEAIKIEKPIVIMGGTTPGHSTDLVGAELAEKSGADRFIIATNVDGIYDKDPNKYDDATQLKEITVKELIEKYGTKWNAAGSNIVIDGPALEVIDKIKIPTFIVNGTRLDQLEKAITNQNFEGTRIKI